MNPQTTVLTPIRRYDVDWLKVLFLYLLFAFQVSRVFDAEMGLQRSIPMPSPGFSYAGFFISQWYIPLVFLVAGWSRKNAMQLHSGLVLLRERLLRLIIPFATGFLLLISLSFYGEMTGGLYREAAGHPVTLASSGGWFFSATPVIFNRPETFDWSYPLFLLYLFAFTIMAWPFFTWLMARKVTPLKTSRIWVYLPIVPLILIRMSGNEHWPEERAVFGNWVMLLYFFAFFILGFIISRYSAYERAIHQEARYAGALGLVLSFVIMTTGRNLPEQIFPIVTPAASWCCTVGILGMTKRYLDAPSSWLFYLMEASLPIFVLHQVSIVLIASVMNRFTIGTSARFMGLLMISLVASFVFYHLGIRRFTLARILFGMKVEKEPVETRKEQVFHRDHL